MTVACDTSVIVAAVLAWHEHHEPSRRALSAALRAGVVLPTRVLVETYAVLTRLPPPHRLSPSDAQAILAGTLQRAATVVGLLEAGYWDLIAGWAANGVAGGSSYDAEIAATAAQAGATRLLTWNTRHLERVASPELEVVSPA